MQINIKENFIKVKNMDRVNIFLQMETFIKALGKMIAKMEWER